MKETTPQNRENVRKLILLELKAAGELGLNHNRIRVGLTAMGETEWSDRDVKEELPLLQQLGFVTQERNPFVGEMARWTLTENGRIALAAQGL
jgi:hypothetical protein